jgi:hypothetical protein
MEQHHNLASLPPPLLLHNLEHLPPTLPITNQSMPLEPAAHHHHIPDNDLLPLSECEDIADAVRLFGGALYVEGQGLQLAGGFYLGWFGGLAFLGVLEQVDCRVGVELED